MLLPKIKISWALTLFLVQAVSYQLTFAQISAGVKGHSTKTDSVLYIGQFYSGGIIVHVDDSGVHGLLAASEDQTEFKIKWGPIGLTWALSASNGRENTQKIVSYFANNDRQLRSTAACLCDELILNGYDDWYLPAIDELMHMYKVKDKIPGIKIGDYTSSTEMRKADAYSIHFRPHRSVIFYYNKKDKDYFVRCFRQF